MKKVIFTLVFSFFSLGMMAQDTISKPDYQNLGITLKISNIPGLSIDYETNDVLFPTEKRATTYVWRVGLTGATVSSGLVDYTGSGTYAEITSREYFGKNKNEYHGLFFENNWLHYTRIKFDDFEYTGTYAHFSFFSPGMGYKLKLGKVNLEASANYQWLIQFKGKGDVDNRIFDNWVFNANIRASYSF
jgi:hypothetical protein